MIESQPQIWRCAQIYIVDLQTGKLSRRGKQCCETILKLSLSLNFKSSSSLDTVFMSFESISLSTRQSAFVTRWALEIAN